MVHGEPSYSTNAHRSLVGDSATSGIDYIGIKLRIHLVFTTRSEGEAKGKSLPSKGLGKESMLHCVKVSVAAERGFRLPVKRYTMLVISPQPPSTHPPTQSKFHTRDSRWKLISCPGQCGTINILCPLRSCGFTVFDSLYR